MAVEHIRCRRRDGIQFLQRRKGLKSRQSLRYLHHSQETRVGFWIILHGAKADLRLFNDVCSMTLFMHLHRPKGVPRSINGDGTARRVLRTLGSLVDWAPRYPSDSCGHSNLLRCLLNYFGIDFLPYLFGHRTSRVVH